MTLNKQTLFSSAVGVLMGIALGVIGASMTLQPKMIPLTVSPIEHSVVELIESPTSVRSFTDRESEILRDYNSNDVWRDDLLNLKQPAIIDKVTSSSGSLAWIGVRRTDSSGRDIGYEIYYETEIGPRLIQSWPLIFSEATVGIDWSITRDNQLKVIETTFAGDAPSILIEYYDYTGKKLK